MLQRKILQEDKNCWRIAQASRSSVLIDGASYFSGLTTILEKAQRSIFILAWDIDSPLRLTWGKRDNPRINPSFNF
jgi:phosphatidylserine/phosphatidylglycerophosphate/cardiolipin synthase-like enzyme